MLLQNMSRAGLLRNVIVLGYVAFYQINKFLVYILFFHHLQNGCAGRSLETPALSKLFKISFHIIVTQQRLTVEQCARKFRNLLLQAKERT